MPKILQSTFMGSQLIMPGNALKGTTFKDRVNWSNLPDAKESGCF